MLLPQLPSVAISGLYPTYPHPHPWGENGRGEHEEMLQGVGCEGGKPINETENITCMLS